MDLAGPLLRPISRSARARHDGVRWEACAVSSSQRPAIASDDWMHEQQVRAELEAEAWRRLRRELATPELAPTTPAPAQSQSGFDHHSKGSTILKAFVRFGLAAFVSYLAYLAAIDSQFGEFEVWLAVGSIFLVTLALSMFGLARELVHTLAETARWALILAVGFGALWVFTHMGA
jgi:hypothetical protein